MWYEYTDIYLSVSFTFVNIYGLYSSVVLRNLKKIKKYLLFFYSASLIFMQLKYPAPGARP
jgi:hypothetical protein